MPEKSRALKTRAKKIKVVPKKWCRKTLESAVKEIDVVKLDD